jgi:hypothetical protein
VHWDTGSASDRQEKLGFISSERSSRTTFIENMARSLIELTVLLLLLLAMAHAVCKPGRPTNKKFVSPTLERRLAEVAAQMVDKELACIFSNTLPNTLDTTVYHHSTQQGVDDTFVVTGDIEAMWLRDSANQVRAALEWCVFGLIFLPLVMDCEACWQAPERSMRTCIHMH